MALDTSILNNTKKILGIPADDDSFDLDVTLQINSAFSTLQNLGVGPAGGFTIEDDEATWGEALPGADEAMINMAKTCVFLKVRLGFDPPSTSYALAALKEQITEHEGRLSLMREATGWADPDPPEVIA